MLQASRNLGTSLRNISNAIEKAVGKHNNSEQTRSANKGSFNSSQAAISSRGRGNSALSQIKDQEYEKMKEEKQQRANRLKEARRKYSQRKADSATPSHNHSAHHSDAKEKRTGGVEHGLRQSSTPSDHKADEVSSANERLER